MARRPAETGPQGPGRRRLRRLTLVVAGLTVMLLAVAVTALQRESTAPWAAADRAGAARMGGPFSLVDRTGAPFSSADLAHRPYLLVFGFTSGRDDQLFRLQAMNLARRALAESHPDIAERLALVFVTLDPAVDTPERLEAWLGPFAFPVVGLTGPETAIAELAAAYRVFVIRDDDPEAAPVERLSFTPLIYLIGPDGTYRAHFPPEIEPDALARELAQALAPVAPAE